MMRLPSALQAVLETELGITITDCTSVGGGDINQAAKIFAASGDLFIKWHSSAPQGMFTAEAKGLHLLASAEAIKVPTVITAHDVPAFLVLEWFETTRPKDTNLVAERLGEGLANLHRVSAAEHGLDHDNFIGRLPQSNQQHATWAEFYGEQRIRQQMEIARQLKCLPPEREKLLSALIQKLSDLVPDAPPVLLHGDLWGGNYSTTTDDTPIIYDPAVYYGHREVDLAMTRLFGGFPPCFYEAYDATYPLETGYQERIELYQLYPLLVHLTHFGGHYGNSVDAIARRYV